MKSLAYAENPNASDELLRQKWMLWDAKLLECVVYLRGCIQKFPDWIDNEIYAYNNKHSLRRNTKCYGGKTH
jgi:hypothetical protein